MAFLGIGWLQPITKNIYVTRPNNSIGYEYLVMLSNEIVDDALCCSDIEVGFYSSSGQDE